MGWVFDWLVVACVSTMVAPIDWLNGKLINSPIAEYKPLSN
jgi:hypothetical protein